MFLIRLIYLKEISNLTDLISESENITEVIKNQTIKKNLSNNQNLENDLLDVKNKTIGQIKNVEQEKKQTEQPILKTQHKTILQIKTFNDLIEICNIKKEIKLKYELETNVNLVSFENKRIEISFNNHLDKEFIKNLSSKLYEWTNDRWIISLSKKIGELSKKEKDIISRNFSRCGIN
jgi:DNA polymerase-3 subunit gamma/tau